MRAATLCSRGGGAVVCLMVLLLALALAPPAAGASALRRAVAGTTSTARLLPARAAASTVLADGPGTPAAPETAVETSDVEVVSWGANRLDLFVRGEADHLHHSVYDTGWRAWEDLGAPGGGLRSAPAATTWAVGRLDVFVIAADGALWQRTYTGSWAAWTSLGMPSPGLSLDPAAVSWGPGRIDVFARGGDGLLWQRTYTGSWGAWSSLPGAITSAPAAVSWEPGRIDIFARGLDNGVWSRVYFGGLWFEWYPLGGLATSAPAAISRNVNRLEVFVRGPDLGLFYNVWDGSAWSGWIALGGTLASGPSAARWSSTHLDVLYWTAAKQVHQKTFDTGSGGWGPAAPRLAAPAVGLVVQTLVGSGLVADGACSLYEALVNADGNLFGSPDCGAGSATSADTITFALGGTITLGTDTPGIMDPAGLLVDGGGRVTISGEGLHRIFYLVSGSLELRNLVLTRGAADPGQGGGAIRTEGGTLTLVNCQVTDSRSLTGEGGGAVASRGTLVVESSTFHGNAAYSGGALWSNGPVTITGSTFTSNDAVGLSGTGGSIFLGENGTLTLVDSVIAGNSASWQGGGLYLQYDTTAALVRSAVTTNAADGWAGGIHTQANLLVANSTISGNLARRFGGGGITNFFTMTLTNSTIAGNASGDSGGGIANFDSATVRNTIIAGNTAPSASDCFGQLAAESYPNFIGTLDCAVSGTAPLTGDPLLGPLANNGGSTFTHALLPGSPAIDAGSDVVCAAVPVSGKDQRGVARPQGLHCDLGAFEAAPTLGGRNMTIRAGSVTLAWTDGTREAGYRVYRVNAVTGAVDLLPPGPPLPATATGYVDGSAVDGNIYCYFATPVDGVGNLLGVSDALCAQPGNHGGPGSALPGAFTLGLNQTATATMTWAPPAGGAESYDLVVLPLNGTPPSILPLPGSAVSHAFSTGGVYHCFILVGKRTGSPPGNTDPLCGLPGVSTLAAGAPLGDGPPAVAAALQALAQADLAAGR